MIAMALALEPRVVIMDEPTTALDVVIQREILEQLSAAAAQLGFSVVFITHDLSLLVEFSDRIAIMYGGRIVEEAPAAEIYREPAAPLQRRTAALLPGAARSAPGADRHPRLAARPAGPADRLPVPAPLPQGLRTLRRVAAAAGPAGCADPARSVACYLHPSALSCLRQLTEDQ